MSLDKFLVNATLVFFCIWLACFTVLIAMIIVDGIRDWRRAAKNPKPIKPTVPANRS